MKIITALILLSSVAAFADTRMTGSEAENLFNALENQFEYRSGAEVSGLKIETIVRHDNSTSCSKESVSYGDEAAEVTFECILK